MNSNRPRVAFIVSVLLGSLLLPVVQAADKAGEGAARALAKAQSLLKQVNAQKTAAETELAIVKGQLADKDQQLGKLAAELKDKKASLNETTASLQAAEQKGASLGSELERTSGRLDKTRERLKKLGARHKETRATLGSTEQARQQLDAELTATRAELKDSESKNLALYEANRETLDKFQHEGVFSRILRSEPLTGIAQVKIETALQEYEQKNADNLRGANQPAATADTP